ncbi:MAG: hypothetical protein K2Q01_10450 [Rickettsiales bacterium]|nr:hypothetical protein [Rickettsiales bacterium]
MTSGSKHDQLRNVTGVIGAREAADATDIGAMLPGHVGNVLEGAGVAFRTAAEETELKEGIDGLAQRMGMTSSQLLSESSLLREDQGEYSTGKKYMERYGGFGVKMGGAIAGGMVGNMILPGLGFGAGAIAGGFAGSYGGGQVSSFLFPEKPVSNIQLAWDAVSKQEQGSLSSQDMLMLVGRKMGKHQQEVLEQQVALGNRDGFGLDYLLEDYVSPVLPPEHYEGSDKTCAQRLADMCNEGKLDVAQLVRDDVYMEALPPRRGVGHGGGDAYASADVAYDSSYEEGQPVRAPRVPRGPGQGLGSSLT